jgi:hypothetical protein
MLVLKASEYCGCDSSWMFWSVQTPEGVWKAPIPSQMLGMRRKTAT